MIRNKYIDIVYNFIKDGLEFCKPSLRKHIGKQILIQELKKKKELDLVSNSSSNTLILSDSSNFSI